MAQPVKTAQRCATAVFCPSAPYVATGTMAGAVDLSFSTTACLEVFKLDFANPKRELPLAGGAVAATERFNRLAWSPLGSETEAHPLGLIAGGQADGTVSLWNPAKIVGSPITDEPSDGSRGSLVTHLQKQGGAVKGLQFNSLTPNLLATGAADGELCIWDLSSPSQPALYPSLKGGSASGNGGSGAGEVTYLAWNCKVQHIVASTSVKGTTIVWDLKRQKPVISFTDPNSNRRCSALQWNPEVATQLIVASDDDRSPSLQVWDLRNSISPAREFHAHRKGVLAMAWSALEPSLLLTCGKDNRTLCWDTNHGEVVAELPASSNWNFDVQWAPRNPGVISTSSFDGRVALFNLQEANAPASATGVQDDFSGAVHAAAGPMRSAPAFMRRPCGATFGFGGRLVSFGVQRDDGSAASPGEICVRAVTDGAPPPGAASDEAADKEFRAALSSGSHDALREYCATMQEATAAVDADEAETWAFLRVLFEDNARRKLLAHLNFPDLPDPAAEEAAAAAAEAAPVTPAKEEPAAAAPAAAAAPPAPPAPPPNDADFFDKLKDDGDDFFDNLPATPKKVAEAAPAAPAAAAAAAAPAAPAAAAGAAGDGWGGADALEVPEPLDEAEAAIQRALVVGNYAAAVQECLRADRMADALVLSSCGGSALWEKTQAEYMRRCPRPYMSVVTAVVKGDLEALVKSRPLVQWKETLAMLCTYSPGADWAAHAKLLSKRLAAAGLAQPALLCAIISGDVETAVRHWAARVQFCGGQASLDALHMAVEKSLVLAHASGRKEVVSALSEVVNAYAEMLAAQGQCESAMHYLSLVPGEDTPETAVLRDRIYRSGLAQQAAAPPPFPFQQQVQAQAAAHHQSQAHHQQAQQQTAYAQQGAYAQPQQQQQSAYAQPQQPQQARAQQSAYAAQPVAGGGAYSAASGRPQANGSAYAPAPAYSAAQPAYSAAQPAYSQQAYSQQAAAAPQQPAAQPQPQAARPSPYAPVTPAAPAYAAPAQPAYAPAAQPAYAPAAPQQPVQHFAPAAAAPPPQPQMFMPQAPAAAPAAPSAVVPKPAGFVPAAPAAPPPQPVVPPARPGMPGAPPAGAPPPAAAAAAPAPAAPPPPAAPAGPPANCSIETVDTSQVAPEHRPIVQSLSNLYGACAAGVAGNAQKKREMDDNSKRLGGLLWKLGRRDVSPGVAAKLLQLCAALDAGDLATASHLQVQLTSSDWDECSSWLPALKRLIKAVQTPR